MENNEWQKVGEIGVDAGLCWLGDPCYILGEDASEQPTKTWNEFCDLLGKKEKKGVAQWQYKTGHDGLGVTVSTGYGDGVYPVFIRRNADGRISAVKVVFN